MNAPTAVIPAPGFADPTREAQLTFRAVLDALSRPTSTRPLTGPAGVPDTLGPALGAVLLTLLDEECSAWLGGRFAADAAVDTWLAFHTGVRRVPDSADADFVVVDAAGAPALDRLARGTDEEPHRSATVVLDVRGGAGPLRYRASGPGIDGSAVLTAPWADEGFLDRWARNAELFPRGVDLLLVDAASVSGLPRTTRLTTLDEPTPDTAQED